MAKVLYNLAEFTFSTFGSVKRNDVITNFDVRHALANGFDDSTSLVSANHGEITFGVFP
jgi:hypothetical protein